MATCVIKPKKQSSSNNIGQGCCELTPEQEALLKMVPEAAASAQTAASTAASAASAAQLSAVDARNSFSGSATNATIAKQWADESATQARNAGLIGQTVEGLARTATEAASNARHYSEDAEAAAQRAETAASGSGGAKEVSYTTESTLYQPSTQIAHVQSPEGDLPLAPMTEVVLHAQNDQGYWAKLQMAMNQITSTQALATKSQQQINDLLVRVAVLENNPAPEPEPVYDMASALTLHTPALLGLLGIEIGGVDLIGDGWTAPGDGLLVVDGASTIGLLTPTWIAVNGIKADPNGVIVLTLLGSDGANGEIRISGGDVITQSGMGNITFYKRIS